MGEWVAATLRDVAELGFGKTPPRAESQFWAHDNGHAWATIADLRHDPVIATAEVVTDAGLPYAGRVVSAGGVMMSFKLTVGRVARAGMDLLTNEAIVSVSGRPGVAADGWLYHALPAIASGGVTDTAVKGVTLNKFKLERLRVVVPPLEEQRRIAEILDTIDETIQATERVIAKLGCTRDAILEDTFGRVARARRWRHVSLDDVASFQTGRAFPSSAYGESGVPLLRPGNFRDGEFIEWTERHTTRLAYEWAETASQYVVRPGDIVMNLTAQSLEGGFLGRVAMVPDSEPTCLLNQRIARLTGTAASASFLFWALRSPAVRSQINRRGQGTKVQHLYDRDLKSLTFAIPEGADEQHYSVAPIWETVRRLGEESRHLSKLRRTRVGLAADLLAGQVRTVTV